MTAKWNFVILPYNKQKHTHCGNMCKVFIYITSFKIYAQNFCADTNKIRNVHNLHNKKMQGFFRVVFNSHIAAIFHNKLFSRSHKYKSLSAASAHTRMISFVFVVVGGTVYPKKYAHGFCFAVLCCGYTLTDFPISNRLTSLALWQSNDCPGASKATLMNMDKYFMWIHYERLHNHNKAKHNTVCIFLGIYCIGDGVVWGVV